MSHSAEKFRKGILVFLKISGFEKFYGWKGGITFFRRNFLVSVPKNFAGIPSMFRKIWGIKKIYA